METLHQASVLVVILNYKTHQMTVDLLDELEHLHYGNYDVMIIDNCSPNESADVLEVEAKKRNHVFYKNKINSGYAAGNNIGIKYGIQHGYDYTWILNNDVKLCDPDILTKLVDAASYERIGSVGPRITDLDGNVCSPYCKRPSFWDMTFGIAAFKKYRDTQKEISQRVYRIHGCCMLLNNQVMQDVNCLDERTFLYCEEEILAERMLPKGISSYYCANAQLVHMESATVKQESKKAIFKRIGIVLDSLDVYLREYRHFGWGARAVCKLIRGGILFFRG